MKINEILTESRSAELYHGTSFKKAEDILLSNVIHATRPIDMGKSITLKGQTDTDWQYIVSLSRSLGVAARFAEIKSNADDNYVHGVVFVLDQEKLYRDHGKRLQPYNDLKYKSRLHTSESEEAFVGNLEKVSTYIKKIYVFTPSSELDHLESVFKILFNHPKTVVVKDKKKRIVGSNLDSAFPSRREIQKYEKTQINEVKIIQTGHEMKEPLKDTDTIRVYHGTSDLQFILNAIRYGTTGDTMADRKYSYEYNNNPKGIFVTPDMKTAKEFGKYIIEFNAAVSDLEAPVWPSGTFTVQGGIASYFKDAQDRENRRLKARAEALTYTDKNIKKSDRPELAVTLYYFGERQALFIGDLNKQSFRAVWERNANRVNSPYKRYSLKEFLVVHKKDFDKNSEKSRYNRYKVGNPRDKIGFWELIDKLKDDIVGSHMGRDDIARAISKATVTDLQVYLWNDRQIREVMTDPEYTRMKNENK